DEVRQLAVEPVDGLAQPEAEIHRHLVVARARGVQPAGRWPDQLAQPRLDIGMDVLELYLESEAALGDLCLYLIEAELDRIAVGLTEDALAHQHGGMGPAAGDVLAPEAAVDADGGVDPLHDLRRAAGKTAAPHAILGGTLVGRWSPDRALGGRT